MDAYQKQFNIQQDTPAYWHNKSQDLLVSARTLWEAMQENKNLEVNCWATYKMLMGMSLELMFKAHCVGAGISFPPTHDLVSLVNTTSLVTSKDEKGILKILSEYIIWDGRYPIPKKPEQLKSHRQNQNKILKDKQQIGCLTASMTNEKIDFDALLLIWRRFSEQFMAEYN